MDQRIALVTGGNKGIGLEICRQLAGLGYAVLLGCRDIAKGEAAASSIQTDGTPVRPVHVDYEAVEAFPSLATELSEEFGRLDVLVNNAGILVDLNLSFGEVSPEMLDKTMQVNFFGPWKLSLALLPLLRASVSPRVVNQSSILGSLTEVSLMKGWETPAYTASKAALNALTVMLAKDLKHGKVNSAHPGYVETDMTGPDAPLKPAQGAETAVRLATLPDDGPTGGFFHFENALRW